ncbi:hypothetical protein UNSW3_326 [Campylobacter concisus UNSW3]|uniref:Uncharacterized protein n=1 Tax=Campylobacter concisus UNSW3 TaxID=1242966 RepID=U2G2N1_9BACT|nr:hypothetical protein UNSW3_326 [Campylobacter concisus UNSW3]
MRQINLKLWQIYPLFGKSNLAQILTAVLLNLSTMTIFMYKL